MQRSSGLSHFKTMLFRLSGNDWTTTWLKQETLKSFQITGLSLGLLSFMFSHGRTKKQAELKCLFTNRSTDFRFRYKCRHNYLSKSHNDEIIFFIIFMSIIIITFLYSSMLLNNTLKESALLTL
jgi:hypothetical protein